MKNIGNVIIFHSGVGKEADVLIFVNTDTTKLKLNSVALVRKRTLQPNDCHMSAKLVPTFANRGCRVVSATDPNGH
jgi:hypothetical protein